MKRLKACPTCDNSNPETFVFCAEGHSLCFSCGWNCELKDCKSKEDKIKRFAERCRWTIEDGDINMIFDLRWHLHYWRDKLKGCYNNVEPFDISMLEGEE